MYDQYIKKTHKYVDGDKCNVYAKRGLYVCGNTNLYVCGNTNLYVERDSCVICMWLKTYKDPRIDANLRQLNMSKKTHTYD